MNSEQMKAELEKAIEGGDQTSLEKLVEQAWGDADAMATIAEFLIPKQADEVIVTHTLHT